NMRRIASDDVAAAIIRLSSHEDGLTQVEADDRRDRFGPNEVAHEKPLPWWLHLWHCYKNPFNLLLTVLAGISFMTDDPTATAVIGTMVVLSTLIRYVQEGRSNRAAERLKAMVGNTASVIRRQMTEERDIDAGDKNQGANARGCRSTRSIELPIR